MVEVVGATIIPAWAREAAMSSSIHDEFNGVGARLIDYVIHLDKLGGLEVDVSVASYNLQDIRRIAQGRAVINLAMKETARLTRTSSLLDAALQMPEKFETYVQLAMRLHAKGSQPTDEVWFLPERGLAIGDASAGTGEALVKEHLHETLDTRLPPAGQTS